MLNHYVLKSIETPGHVAHYRLATDKFRTMPGFEFAFWLSPKARVAFVKGIPARGVS